MKKEEKTAMAEHSDPHSHDHEDEIGIVAPIFGGLVVAGLTLLILVAANYFLSSY